MINSLKGQSAPTGLCQDGYNCEPGFNFTTATPRDHICDEGYYCEAGQQIPCKEGFFCPRKGMMPKDFSDSTYQCSKGFICKEGSKVPNPGLNEDDTDWTIGKNN